MAKHSDEVATADMPRSMRQRVERSWNLRVYEGRDPVTGRKISVERTVRGTKRGLRDPGCHGG